jgi:hypothetical protein
MITSKILRLKKVFTKSNGDTLADLISSTFSFIRSGGRSDGFIRVKEEEAMRPDLISVRMYGKHDYHDMLMKYNGISNPFSISPGEILIVPPFRDIEQMLIAPRVVPEKGQARKASNEDKLLNPKTDKDRKRLEALKDRVKEIVPPNINTEGNRNVKVQDGRVIFGEDVTQVNKDNCPVPISRARLIQQLTKSSLF